MTSDESRLEILRKVEDGTLSIEEGSDLIRILDEAREVSLETEVSPTVGEPRDSQVSPETSKTPGCWKAAWRMILLTGTLLATFSVYWVYQGYQKAGLSWGFWLSWIPLIIGTVVMIIGGVFAHLALVAFTACHFVGSQKPETQSFHSDTIEARFMGFANVPSFFTRPGQRQKY